MKAYPLIYSRTKEVDYVPQFLARPAEMTNEEIQLALKYTANAMSGIDYVSGVRYSVFSVGNFCICGGVSCLSKNIIELLYRNDMISETEYHSAEEFLYDRVRRNVAFFIGFAIQKSDIRSGKIPNITLRDYWIQYLEQLKKQWSAKETHSELLNEPIEISEKTYSRREFAPEIDIVEEKRIIKNFISNENDVLEHYFDRILNQGENASFISDVLDKNLWNGLVFTDVAVSDELYSSLKKFSTEKPGKGMDSVLNFNIAKSQRSPSVSNGYSILENTEIKRTKPIEEFDDSKKNGSTKFKEFPNYFGSFVSGNDRSSDHCDSVRKYTEDEALKILCSLKEYKEEEHYKVYKIFFENGSGGSRPEYGQFFYDYISKCKLPQIWIQSIRFIFKDGEIYILVFVKK